VRQRHFIDQRRGSVAGSGHRRKSNAHARFDADACHDAGADTDASVRAEPYALTGALVRANCSRDRRGCGHGAEQRDRLSI
jgi:hypothetical protein